MKGNWGGGAGRALIVRWQMADQVKFVDGAVLVGHNVPFDLRMLNSELARLSMPLVPGVAVLCTKQVKMMNLH